MKDDEILKRLNEVFCDVMDDEAIVLSHSTNASDIEEWDSLNQIKIILACEKEFGVASTCDRFLSPSVWSVGPRLSGKRSPHTGGAPMCILTWVHWRLLVCS